jgi:hypothetical protein
MALVMFVWMMTDFLGLMRRTNMANLCPVQEMTERQWDMLDKTIKTKYPAVLGGQCNVSHSNYYICAIMDYVQNGGKIYKAFWNHLNIDYQNTLIRVNNNQPPIWEG